MSLLFLIIVFAVSLGNLNGLHDISAQYPGDLILGALFAVHQQPTGASLTCGAVRENYGIQRVEATLQTLDIINKGDLLGGIRLGAELRDSCWHAPSALQQTLELVRDSLIPRASWRQPGCKQDTNKGVIRPPLIGVLGPGSSSLSMQVQNLLQLFSIPQVGYSATSRELSDKTKYSTFMRVVPSDQHQAQVLVKLLQHNNWTYVFALYTDENYGQSGISSFREAASKESICVAQSHGLSSSALDEEFDNVITNIAALKSHKDEVRSRVAVCFCEGRTIRGLLASIRRLHLTGQMLLIGSDGWADRADVPKGFEREAEGSISLRISSPPVMGFDEYYVALNPYNNTRNPWFKEFWEYKFNCSLRSNALHDIPPCTGRESLAKDYRQEPKLSFVVRGIWAMAHALKDMHRYTCPNKHSICKKMLPFNLSLYQNFLYKVSFRTPDGQKVKFDHRGDPPARFSDYDIMNFVRVKNGWRYVQVGTWTNGALSLQGRPVYSGAGSLGGLTKNSSQVRAVCSLPCPTGQFKSGDSCCWSCIPCPAQHILANETSCQACLRGSFPDRTRMMCVNSPLEYPHWHEPTTLAAAACAAFGLAACIVTTGAFAQNWHTPVVKSSSRELAVAMLAGLAGAHSSVFAILSKPAIISCTLANILPASSLSLVYASLMSRTHLVARVLPAAPRRPTLASPQIHLAICVFGGILGFLAALTGSVFRGWGPRTIYPRMARALLVCAEWGRLDAVLMPLSPALMLLTACAILAIRSRSLPKGFNEARQIGVAIYTTCVIWIAFVPIYRASEAKALTLAWCVTLSAHIALMLLFGPRLIVLAARPERNTRAQFVPASNIRCHIGPPTPRKRTDNYKACFTQRQRTSGCRARAKITERSLSPCSLTSCQTVSSNEFKDITITFEFLPPIPYSQRF